MVNIDIYDLKGIHIKSLVKENKSAGFQVARWDGTNNLGQLVSAGMYIYNIQVGDFKSTKKNVTTKVIFNYVNLG